MKTSNFPSFQSEDSSSLQSIGFALPESALQCSTSPSLASTASPSAFAKLLVSTSPWSEFSRNKIFKTETSPSTGWSPHGSLFSAGFPGQRCLSPPESKTGNAFHGTDRSSHILTPTFDPLLRSFHPGGVRRNLCNLHLPPLLPVHDRDRGRDDQHGPGLKKKKDSGRRSSFQCSGLHVCQWVDCSQVRSSPL